MQLQKILWTNIAELRLAEARRKRATLLGYGLLTALVLLLTALLILK
jgi:hypothetical protein